MHGEARAADILDDLFQFHTVRLMLGDDYTALIAPVNFNSTQSD